MKRFSTQQTGLPRSTGSPPPADESNFRLTTATLAERSETLDSGRGRGARAATPWAEEEEDGNSGGWWMGEQKVGSLNFEPGTKNLELSRPRPFRKIPGPSNRRSRICPEAEGPEPAESPEPVEWVERAAHTIFTPSVCQK